MVWLQSLHSVGVVTISFFNPMPYSCLVPSDNNITWFLFAFFLFLFNITWCMCCRDYGLCFGGGSYSAVYVPPPLCVFPMVLMLHIPSFFFLIYVLCAHFFIHLCP